MSQKTKCDPQILSAAVVGRLDHVAERNIEIHLETCSRCQKTIERLAAEKHEWEKISDYFLREKIDTSSVDLAPTVEVQLSKNSSENLPLYSIAEANGDIEPNHAEILQPANHPEMLGRIDSFEIEQMIGRGGMGIVYRGFDSELNRPVAIKLLAQHLATNGVARKRFAREAQAAAAVIHPNVVPIHSVNSQAKQPYIVMTLVSGRSIQTHVTECGPLPLKDIVRIGKQIAAGLAAAHREGLVHRDIKPANILLENDVSRVMITDFGLARAVDDAAITQTGWLAGTPHYMSPEQATGKEVDHRSDLFSLGSVLYFMATGREPFRAEIPIAVLQKIHSEDPKYVRSANNEITTTLSNVIEKLMAKNPCDRFQAAEDVEKVLTNYLAHLEQPSFNPKPVVKKPRKKSLISTIWLLATPALVAITLLPWFLWLTTKTKTITKSQKDQAWPADLVSPTQWEREIELLTTDIELVEQKLKNRKHQLQSDFMEYEILQLNRQLQQLENNLNPNVNPKGKFNE